MRSFGTILVSDAIRTLPHAGAELPRLRTRPFDASEPTFPATILVTGTTRGQRIERRAARLEKRKSNMELTKFVDILLREPEIGAIILGDGEQDL